MSNSKYEAADLILKLYDLRREAVMREARQWYFRDFHPESLQDISAAAMGEHSAYYRMVTTYWDMAASLVINGAIDEQMFNDANGEHVGIYAKVEPFIPEIRAAYGNPTYLKHLEELVRRMPHAEERLAKMREMFKQFRSRADAGKEETSDRNESAGAAHAG